MSRAKTEEATKASLLADAALTLFATRGIDGVSMDDIAAGAGVTKGSVYWHYSSKKEIILAACAQYYARWRVQMASVCDAEASPRAKVVAAISFSVRSCLLDESNRVFTTEIVALALYDAEIRASWSGFLDETERLFLGLAHRAVGAGGLQCSDVDQGVTLLMAAMEGIKQIALFRPHYGAVESADRVSHALLTLLDESVT